MTSNNGLMTYKKIYLSFLNKTISVLLFGLLLVVFLPCTYLVFTYWSEIPLFMKILWPMLLTVIFVGIIITPLNGMIITKQGTILFLPDFRIKKLNIKDLEKMVIIFHERENNKYTSQVKFIYSDGNVFVKDYSKQFRNMKHKKLAMLMYTIEKRKVDIICKKLLDLDVCVITILDKNRKTIYQK